jgi:HSP20 family molecular chaperone IbpA
MRRAYELSDQWRPEDKHTADWLRAESELVIRPAMEFLRTRTGWRVELALPGMTPNDIEIRVGEQLLSVQAERSTKRTDGQLLVSEYTSSRIYREVTLPQGVDRSKIRATHKDGVLAIELPAETPKTSRTRAAASSTRGRTNTQKTTGKKASSRTASARPARKKS